MDAKLENIYRQIPASKCPDNCGKCCGPVFPSMAELRNISSWCSIHHIEFKDFLDIDKDGSCPYLNEDKKCQIYPVRPFLCRILGVIQPLPCPIKMCLPSKVLNQPCSDALYKAIYLHGKEKPRTEKRRRIISQYLQGALNGH
jgi:hypothetical protein